MNQQDYINAFNQYCADVMGYEVCKYNSYKRGNENAIAGKYNPYNNINQLAEVFDKLSEKMHTKSVWSSVDFGAAAFNKDIATAMREFIWSTYES